MMDQEAQNAVLDAYNRLRDAVQSFEDAYPHEVFPPLTPEEFSLAVNALRECGVGSERLHADWARRISQSIFRMVLPDD